MMQVPWEVWLARLWDLHSFHGKFVLAGHHSVSVILEKNTCHYNPRVPTHLGKFWKVLDLLF